MMPVWKMKQSVKDCRLCLLQNGQTPHAIAQKLGYISVVEILKPVTEVQGITPSSEDKYKVVSPETMQETFISDSEDEGGKGYNLFTYLLCCISVVTFQRVTQAPIVRSQTIVCSHWLFYCVQNITPAYSGVS